MRVLTNTSLLAARMKGIRIQLRNRSANRPYLNAAAPRMPRSLLRGAPPPFHSRRRRRRDLHGFNVFFRSRPQYEVVGFTADQIPEISCRLYSPELSGELYPDGLSIWPEDSLEEIIKSYMINRCILAYSDLSNQAVMDLASRVLATGTDFGFSVAGIRCWSLRSQLWPFCAVRTGAGKSQTVRYVAD